MYWLTTRFTIDLTQPCVMGIVNVTPDSFFDGGRHANTMKALAHCERLLTDGAHILDIGAESTRPGALTVPLDEELARLLPVVTGAIKLGCPVSVDTQKPEVMRAVLGLGADIINDINALQAPAALDVVAGHGRCGVCLMHMHGTPESMQVRPAYDDVVEEVSDFLRSRAHALETLGVSSERIVFDPGIGFGKSPEHNIALLRRQRELLVLGRPLLVGWSRKATLGVITGRGVADRQSASVAAALAAVQNGARIVRVHDVAQTVDAFKLWSVAGLPG
jgi:dihydropteroate synthase